MTDPNLSRTGDYGDPPTHRRPLDPAETQGFGQDPTDGRMGETRAPFSPPWAEGGLPTGGLPERIGDYRVLGLLGEGGMGTVYLAEDMRLGRKAAVKVMRRQAAADPAQRARFLREAKAAAAVEHDHIVPIRQVGEAADGSPFIVMPLLTGESLESRLEREPIPAPALALRIARETAEGLAAAHAAGLIHRDVKPDNLWLEGDPAAADPALQVRRCRLLDFGLARGFAAEDLRLTVKGALLGTPRYMAPEQARGDAVDPRADLFSLGVMLYRMTVGRFPFDGQSVMSILTALATVRPPAPRDCDRRVPAELSDLIERLLAKSPDDRPASAAATVEALRRIEANLDRPAPSALADWRRYWPLAATAGAFLLGWGLLEFALAPRPLAAPAPVPLGTTEVLIPETVASMNALLSGESATMDALPAGTGGGGVPTPAATVPPASTAPAEAVDPNVVTDITDDAQIVEAVGLLVVGAVKDNGPHVLEVPITRAGCVAIAADGWFLTARHVIEDYRTWHDDPPNRTRAEHESVWGTGWRPKLWVFLGKHGRPAELVHTGDRLDFAVVKIDRVPGRYFRAAPALPKRGQPVVSFGFAGSVRFVPTDEEKAAWDQRRRAALLEFSAGRASVPIEQGFYARNLAFGQSDGTVSQLEEDDDGTRWVRHSAPLDWGDSGGPIVTPDGLLLGINTRASRGTNVPVSYALAFPQLGDEIRRKLPQPKWPF